MDLSVWISEAVVVVGGGHERNVLCMSDQREALVSGTISVDEKPCTQPTPQHAPEERERERVSAWQRACLGTQPGGHDRVVRA